MLPDLRTLCSAGEVCPPDVARKWGRGRRFLNGYGPTEATVAVSYGVLEDGTSDDGPVSIGKPVDGARSYVVDGTGALVPVGVPGELWVGGVGVARGYLDRPELTAERFVEDPFTGVGRVFRTGDRVRWRPDGQLEYLGRADDQIKLRGFRIEPGEIEAVLISHPSVRDAAVVVREDSPGLQMLVAYAVIDPDGSVDDRELRSWIRRKVPEYMVPAVVVEVDGLPLTLNGKVDRAALPRPERAVADVGIGDAADGEAASCETQVAGLFHDLLGLPQIDRDDDFFDLGGNSLLATQLFARLESTFGVTLPLATLFEDATVSTVARAVDAARTARAMPAVVDRSDSQAGQPAAEPATGTSDHGGPVRTSEELALLKDGTGPILFLVHELTGEVLVYRNLVQELPEEINVYGLRARGIDRQRMPWRRVDQMARGYVERMREVQPQGPYFIGGLCFGGVMALEVAHQLEVDGQEVGLVLPIDAVPRTPRFRDLGLEERAHYLGAVAARTSLGRRLRPSLEPWLSRDRRFR